MGGLFYAIVVVVFFFWFNTLITHFLLLVFAVSGIFLINFIVTDKKKKHYENLWLDKNKLCYYLERLLTLFVWKNGIMEVSILIQKSWASKRMPLPSYLWEG